MGAGRTCRCIARAVALRIVLQIAKLGTCGTAVCRAIGIDRRWLYEDEPRDVEMASASVVYGTFVCLNPHDSNTVRVQQLHAADGPSGTKIDK